MFKVKTKYVDGNFDTKSFNSRLDATAYAITQLARFNVTTSYVFIKERMNHEKL